LGIPNPGTGRCEEIEKLVWGNFGSKKSRARMPSKRSLGRRHTFCISLDFGQIDFFTSSRRDVTVKIIHQRIASSHAVTVPSVTRISHQDQLITVEPEIVTNTPPGT
jgi:hypothetical protein